MRDISLRNLTESRGFEDEKTENAVHQCSACGVYDDICPSGQCICSGGGTPENGITAQENAETATTIPTTGMKITKGGDYEIKGDTYTGGITVNASDNDEVTIHIASNVKFTRDNQVFIWVENAKLVTIENTDNHTVTLNGQHFYDLSTASNGVESVINGGTYIAPGRNMIMVQGTNNTLTLNNVNIQTNTGYAVTTDSNTVYVNGGTFTKTSSLYSEFKNQGHLTLTDVTVTPQVAVDGKTSTIVENYTGAVVEINGGNYKTTNQSCIVNNGTVTINNGTTTDGVLESVGISCIQNNWGRVEINDGTITSDADCTIKNRGGLRMNGGTVATSNAEGTVIDCNGDFGDTQINGGTIKGGKDGIRLADLGSSEVTLKNAAFENNTQSNIHLGEGQTINIKKTFTGTAKIRVDDPARGRQITTDNEDLSYQNKLKLFSMNPGYIIGYKRGDDGVEYRYLAPANGKTVNAVNAKATANLGAGEQELDTATVVPENTLVTVTANLPEGAEGAEFLGWSAVRDDGKELDLGDDQTAQFKMPGCNVTVEALYQGGNVDPVNPGGGSSSDVVAGIAAVALTGAAVWGIYETGTGIYRVLNMPGVPMPSNRAGLATLIWEKAGCPEPQTVKSFSDIDDADLHLRQAASWMEEKGLMDDVKENEFRPYRYVTKLQTCLVWDKAKEKSLIS